MPRGIEKIAEDTWFYRGFSNAVIRETDKGLILIDPAASWDTKIKHEAVRSVTGSGLHTAIYTHGHNDHTFGVQEYIAESEKEGWPPPKVIAQERILARLKRYRETLRWNALINLRQFRGGVGEPGMAADVYLPDVTYQDRMTITVGRVVAELRHAKGETDDATWIFFPDNKVLCTGDLFIWAIPNAGNPQKVQRYAKEWSIALREMASLGPEVLAPGHGVPIIGKERVVQALMDTAELLESLHDQTVLFMNRGASLDTILHSVMAPEELLGKPYLQPVYDEPEFVVRNIWRLYGGWYDGMPSHIKPAPEKAQAEEIARLVGGAERLAERAKELVKEGNLRLASHLAEWAHLASPDDTKIMGVAGEVFMARAVKESSTMAAGIFLTAAREMGRMPDDVMPGKTVIHAQDQRAKKQNLT
jgi:alkyl sulfatase BDS1-like metallo-beta-lactamase superfamily hydrolase